MISGNVSSIKTIDVNTPPPEANYSTLGSSGVHQIDWTSSFGTTCTVAPEMMQPSVFRLVVNMLKVYLRGARYFLKLPNAVRDVEERHEPALLEKCYAPLRGFLTAPPSATLNVIDKKYSEVFQEVFALRHPEDPDDPVPTETAYWNALKTLASAYNILTVEHPRSDQLGRPTAVVDNTGGVRLIWRTPAKQVKANFGGRPDLKSYIYYESGQVYDTEALDAHTLARRLGWLV